MRLLTAGRAGREVDRLVRGLAVPYLAAASVLAVALAASAQPAAIPLLAELRRSGVAALGLASLLPGLAGLAGAALIGAARSRAIASAGGPTNAASRAARWPQVVVAVPLGIAAAVIAWQMRPLALPLAAPARDAYWIAGAAILSAFPLLVAERAVAALSPARLPEAADLCALLRLPVLVWVGAGLLELAATAGAALAAPLGAVLALLVGAVGVELAARAAGRSFLPPPAPDAARAAVRSILARALADGGWARNGLTAPIRDHLGIDFSRSWALAYLRAAGPPLLLLLLALAWGVSGVVLVHLDGRAIYERLGVPVAVLHPGLHLILPWPLGRAVPGEFGALHEVAPATADAAGADPAAGAEGPAPPGADRLWAGVHPAELAFLVAAESADGAQGFRTVSADLRVLFRVGLSDADALRAAYAAVEPAATVRAAAGRLAARFFAGQTADAVLGADREAMAERLRERLQADRTVSGSGLEVVAVVVEAIHPPAGAADAYHGVQAAEIAARATVAAEHGRAFAVRAAAGQHATETVNDARGSAAETTGGAKAELVRFTADREAAAVGGAAFLLERYLAAVTASLARVPLTIIDSRIAVAGGSVLDLRPPAAAGAPGTARGME